MANDGGADGGIDARIDSAGREGLAGTASSEVYAPSREVTEISTAPGGEALATQPQWRRDFPVDWPVDQYVARRDFGRFLVLTSGAFVAGQAWIVALDLVRKRRIAPLRQRIASTHDIGVGGSLVFAYPTEHHLCLLVCPEAGVYLAYSQSCTHLSCAVVPRVAEGVLHCPCHEGYFDLRTGKNIAGPPPRPLPRVQLAIEGNEVFAIGLDERTV
jgi:nitrite reductase/ring-hydroxylating ferredoxin subunit